MSVHVLEHEGEIVTGYDSLPTVQWCTPSVAGISACITASASGGTATVAINLRTPIGSFSKSFAFNKNICYTWRPRPMISVTPCISNFRVSGNQLGFTLSIRGCVKLVFKNICTPTFSRQFSIPLRATEAEYEISEEHYAQALLSSHELEAESSGDCINCQ